MATKVQTLPEYITEQNALGYQVCLVLSSADTATTDALEPDSAYQYDSVTGVRSEADSHFAVAIGRYEGFHLLSYSNRDHLDELLLALRPEFEPGCLFDGALGYEHNARRVVSLAKQHGYVPDFLPPPIADKLTEFEVISHECNDGGTYLEQFAPDGYWIGWHKGDFGVWPNEDEEPEGHPCDNCGSTDNLLFTNGLCTHCSPGLLEDGAYVLARTLHDTIHGGPVNQATLPAGTVVALVPANNQPAGGHIGYWAYVAPGHNWTDFERGNVLTNHIGGYGIGLAKADVRLLTEAEVATETAGTEQPPTESKLVEVLETGDVVDLKRCPYLGKTPCEGSEYEWGRVYGLNRETPESVTVRYVTDDDNEDLIDEVCYPVGTTLYVIDQVASRYEEGTAGRFIAIWSKEGYGVAVLNDSGLVEAAYADPDDYPDEPIRIAGSNAKFTSHQYRGWDLMLHSGHYEEQQRQERKRAESAPDYLGEGRKLRELEGEDYELMQVDHQQAATLDYVDWAQALEECGWIKGRRDVTGVVARVGDGEYLEIWGTNEAFPYGLDATYYRLK